MHLDPPSTNFIDKSKYSISQERQLALVMQGEIEETKEDFIRNYEKRFKCFLSN